MTIIEYGCFSSENYENGLRFGVIAYQYNDYSGIKNGYDTYIVNTVVPSIVTGLYVVALSNKCFRYLPNLKKAFFS